jgi:hypothetical protein
VRPEGLGNLIKIIHPHRGGNVFKYLQFIVIHPEDGNYSVRRNIMTPSTHDAAKPESEIVH